MKNLILFALLSVIFFSCEKEQPVEPTPDPTPTVDTTTVQVKVYVVQTVDYSHNLAEVTVKVNDGSSQVGQVTTDFINPAGTQSQDVPASGYKVFPVRLKIDMNYTFDLRNSSNTQIKISTVSFSKTTPFCSFSQNQSYGVAALDVFGNPTDGYFAQIKI